MNDLTKEEISETAKLSLMTRVLTMSDDYDISLKEALIREFEGMDYTGIVNIQDPYNIDWFDFFLYRLGIQQKDYEYFTELMYN